MEDTRRTVSRLMKLHEMNAARLAVESGVTYSHLSNMLRGERQASMSVWNQVLAVFGMQAVVMVVAL